MAQRKAIAPPKAKLAISIYHYLQGAQRSGDYYRFSRQAAEEVLLAGMNNIRSEVVMLPPRIIGSGIKN